jgi:hypothetical protein
MDHIHILKTKARAHVFIGIKLITFGDMISESLLHQTTYSFFKKCSRKHKNVKFRVFQQLRRCIRNYLEEVLTKQPLTPRDVSFWQWGKFVLGMHRNGDEI